MEDKEYTINLLEVASILKNNIKPIVKITAMFIVAGILFVIIASSFFPRFKSDAVLQIKQGKGSGVAAMLAGLGGGVFGTEALQMESYIEILKSRSVVIPVIEATEELDFWGRYPLYTSYVKKQISTEAVPMTDILKVSVYGETREKAQKTNQLLLKGFLQRVSELNSMEKGAQKKFLTERLKTSREELDKAELALQKYKEDHKIISPAANAEIFAQRITEIEQQAAVNQVALEAAEAKLASINRMLTSDGAASADNRTIQQYNNELAKLEATRISYLEKYTEKHPKMIEINDNIAKLKEKIQEEVAKVANLQAPTDNSVHQGLVAGKYQSEGEVAVARKKAEALQQLINRNNVELEKLPELEKGYIKVERDFKVANEVYLMLTKKLEETKITELQQPDNVLLVDEPTYPDVRDFPKTRLTLILAAILGLLCSSGYVVMKELEDKPIRTAESIVKFSGLPVLSVIPDKTRLNKARQSAQEVKQNGFLNKVREFIWKK